MRSRRFHRQNNLDLWCEQKFIFISSFPFIGFRCRPRRELWVALRPLLSPTTEIILRKVSKKNATTKNDFHGTFHCKKGLRPRTYTLDPRRLNQTSSSSGKKPSFFDQFRPRSKSDAASSKVNDAAQAARKANMFAAQRRQANNGEVAAYIVASMAENDADFEEAKDTFSAPSSNRATPTRGVSPQSGRRVTFPQPEDASSFIAPVKNALSNMFRGRSASSAAADDKRRLQQKVRRRLLQRHVPR